MVAVVVSWASISSHSAMSSFTFATMRRREAWAEKEMEVGPVSLRVNSRKHPGAELVGAV